jgi:branched-chain amino acid transport system substrate-binding protein
MIKLRKRVFLYLFAIMLSSHQGAVYAGDKFEVLAILPLSGDLASIGEAVKNGIELSLSQNNGRDVLSVHFEDDAGLPKNTVSALLKQKALKKPDVIITVSSATSKAISPITEKMKIPLIAIATDEEISKGKEYAFNFWLTPDDAVELLFEEAKRRGYRKIALFTSVHPGTNSLRRAVNNKKGVLDIVYEEEVDLDARDFKSLITKFRNKTRGIDIDAILTNVFFGQVGIFARQLRELGFRQDLFCAELFEDEGEVASSGGALYGQWYVQADDPEGAFLATYQERYPGSSSYGAANGADAVSLVIATIRKGARSSQEIADQFRLVREFEGYSGAISYRGDNRFTFPATVKIVTREGFRKCGEECQR